MTYVKKMVGPIIVVIILVLCIESIKYYNYIDAGVNYIKNVQYNTNNSANAKICLDQLKLDAENICVLNADSMSVLYGLQENEKIAPASTTKMMTAIIVMDYCSLEDEVTVGDEIEQVAADASVAGLHRGDVSTIDDLLYALLLPSGNDAAYTLAAYTGRKIAGDDTIDYSYAVELFVDKMNEKAKKLNADNTHFIRPDGYDSQGQYSTAYDLTLIAQHLLENQELSQVVSTQKKRCLYVSGEDITYVNTNEMLDKTSEFYDSNVIGIKTGSSEDAGKCLVSGAKINGKLYICAMMGDSETGRFQDSFKVYKSLE